MKNIFRKAITILGSAALIGMTVGAASAASYPAPFTSNTAIVVGANAAPSDNIAASSIASDLTANAAGGTIVLSGEGDVFKFEKASTKFNLGDNITTVVASSLDDDELPTLLAAGKYIDNDNDEFDYTQKITIGPTIQLSMFDDDDYKEDSPTVGLRILSGTTVLNYTIDMSDQPLLGDLVTTELPFMGKKYYILSNTTSGANFVMNLLDSADSEIISEGETKTLIVDGKTYDVSVNFIGSTPNTKLTINGETTNSLANGQTQKLSGGAYVGVKEVLYTSKDTGISKVEFSIGSGKLTLTSGSEIKINDDAISGLYSYITNTSGTKATAKLDNIVVKWQADEDLFMTEDTEIEMPGFKAVKMSYGGLTYPAEETIEVKKGGTTYATLNDFPLKDGKADIDILYGNSTVFTGLGKDATNKLVTGTTGLTFNGNNVDDYFVVTYASTTDAESYLMRATNFVVDGTSNKTDFQYYKNGAWVDKKTGAKQTDTFSIGNAEVVVGVVTKVGTTKTVAITNGSTSTNFNQLYSAEGLRVLLPVTNSTSKNIANGTTYAADVNACNAVAAAIRTHMLKNPGEFYNGKVIYNKTGSAVPATTSTAYCTPATSFRLVMNEEDKDGNKAAANGDQINVTLGWDASTTKNVEVSSYTTENTDATSAEIGNTNVWRDFTYSPLATEILFEQPDSGQKSIKLIYHGDEVEADAYITSPDATTTSGGEAGVMTVTDANVGSVATKNLVVVGGSAINSVAAELLGDAYSESAFTSATGVAAGEFLIQSFSRSGKTALLVAGYNAADTEKATTYLLNNAVDTTVGKKYKGTSATEASLVVA